MNRSLVAVIGILLLFTSCNIDDCPDPPSDTSSLESEYDCQNTKYQLDIDVKNDFTIIQSQVDFENVVSGSCEVDVDFERFDLLIGRQSLSNGNDTIEYRFERSCDVMTSQLFVTFLQNLTDIAPSLTYHILFEKLRDGEMVDVIIEEKY